MIKQNSKGDNRGIIAVSILDKNIKAHLCLHIKETHRASISIPFWNQITLASGLDFLGLKYTSHHNSTMYTLLLLYYYYHVYLLFNYSFYIY